LQRIYWMAENFPDPKRSNVQELAVSYARGEVQEEWPLMGKGQISPHAEQRAHQLAGAVRKLSPKTTVQSELYTDALGRVDVLRETGPCARPRFGRACPRLCGSSWSPER
jgi:hypothetical protein